MWIMKNSKNLLETLNARLVSEYKSIKTYDFSILYTCINHTQLKYRLKNIIHRCYSEKAIVLKYKHVVLSRDSSYFVKNNPESSSK